MRKIYFNYQCLYLILLFKIANGGLVKEISGTSQETAKKVDDKIHKVLQPKENNAYIRIERRRNVAGGYLPGRKQSDKRKINHEENSIKYKVTGAGGFKIADNFSTWLRLPSVTPSKAEQVSKERLFLFDTPRNYTVQGTARKNNSDERGNFTGGYLLGRKLQTYNKLHEKRINLKLNNNIKYEKSEEPLFTFAASTAKRLPQVIPNVTPTVKQISAEPPVVFVTSSTLRNNIVQETTINNNSHIRIDGKRNIALKKFLPGKRLSDKTRVNLEENIIKYEETEVLGTNTTTKSISPIIIIDLRANFVGGCLNGTDRADGGTCEEVF